MQGLCLLLGFARRGGVEDNLGYLLGTFLCKTLHLNILNGGFVTRKVVANA